VLIRAAAEGTDTYELNRNLVLTDGARADSVPNLEIETGEIAGAGHASATGRFDDEQLFYLQAAGIPEIEARRLVVRGFFAELVQRIGVPGIEERLNAGRFEGELGGVQSAGGTLPSLGPRGGGQVPVNASPPCSPSRSCPTWAPSASCSTASPSPWSRDDRRPRARRRGRLARTPRSP
jgi:hypothetical protein